MNIFCVCPCGTCHVAVSRRESRGGNRVSVGICNVKCFENDNTAVLSVSIGVNSYFGLTLFLSVCIGDISSFGLCTYSVYALSIDFDVKCIIWTVNELWI